MQADRINSARRSVEGPQRRLDSLKRLGTVSRKPNGPALPLSGWLRMGCRSSGMGEFSPQFKRKPSFGNGRHTPLRPLRQMAESDLWSRWKSLTAQPRFADPFPAPPQPRFQVVPPNQRTQPLLRMVYLAFALSKLRCYRRGRHEVIESGDFPVFDLNEGHSRASHDLLRFAVQVNSLTT